MCVGGGAAGAGWEAHGATLATLHSVNSQVSGEERGGT